MSDTMIEVDKKLTNLEDRSKILEQYVDIETTNVYTKVSKPFWAEGGWMCNICLKFIRRCGCKKQYE